MEPRSRRAQIERQIVTCLAETILSEKYFVEIDNGGGADDMALTLTNDHAAVMEALFATGQETIFVCTPDGRTLGWFYANYGSGYHVIGNQSVNAICDKLSEPAEKLADQLEDGLWAEAALAIKQRYGLELEKLRGDPEAFNAGLFEISSEVNCLLMEAA